MQESMPNTPGASGSMGWIIGGIAAIILVGGYFLFANSESEDKMMEEKAMMEQKKTGEEKKMMEEKAMMEKKAMDEKAMIEKKAMEEKTMIEKKAMEEKAMMQKTGSYVPYDAAKLANAEKGDVVLFFHAGWCPKCVTSDKNFKASATPDGLTLMKLDYDNSTDLKQKYGVTIQHTFVQVDKDGKLIKKWSGSSTYDDLKAQIQ